MGLCAFKKRKKPSPSRKINLLPRIGIYVDFAGYEFVFKHAPLLEAMICLPERGINLAQLLKISKEQLAEIKFPLQKEAKIVSTTARTIATRLL